MQIPRRYRPGGIVRCTKALIKLIYPLIYPVTRGLEQVSRSALSFFRNHNNYAWPSLFRRCQKQIQHILIISSDVDRPSSRTTMKSCIKFNFNLFSQKDHHWNYFKYFTCIRVPNSMHWRAIPAPGTYFKESCFGHVLVRSSAEEKLLNYVWDRCPSSVVRNWIATDL